MKNKSKFFVRLLCLALVLTLFLGTVACNTTVNNENNNDNAQQEPVNKYGNSHINLLNNAYVAKQGEWIYYATDKGVFKIKEDGTEKQKLFDGECSGVSVMGEWVYFRQSQTIDYYRIKTDGTGYETFLSNVYRYCLFDGWIYYTRMFDDGLYKIKADDKMTRTRIIDDKVQVGFTVVDDKIHWLYDGKIREYDLDGNFLTEYTGARSLLSEDGYYYSIERTKDYKYYIKKSKLDGSDVTEINTNSQIEHATVYNGWIYYTTGYQVSKFCRIKTDGTENQVLLDGLAVNVGMIDDWIYYKLGTLMKDKNDYEYSYYKMRLDGSENQRIEE